MKRQNNSLIAFSAALNEPPAQVARKADEIINRRNDAIHFESIADLDEEFSLVLGALKKYPGLGILCKKEVQILEHWGELKSAFGL